MTESNNGLEEDVMMSLRALDIKNLISNLPDLCLLEIFKHLPRVDIDNFKLVNKIMYAISSDKSLDKIKWEGANLSIFSVENGYGFELASYNKPCNTSYLYKIFEVNGFLKEERAMRYLEESEEFFIHRRPKWPVPVELFAALPKLLRYHEVSSLRVKQIQFCTSSFFDDLQGALEDHRIEYIEFSKAGIDRDDAIRKSFLQLAKNAKQIRIVDASAVILVTEDTFREIMDSQLDTYSEQMGGSPAIYALSIRELRFKVDASALPRIIRSDTLHAPAMTINANWVANLCMMYMAAREPRRGRHDTIIGELVFNVDRPLTSLILSEPIRASDYEYKPSQHVHDRVDHYIVRKADQLTARITVSDHRSRMDEEAITVVIVEFRSTGLHADVTARSRPRYYESGSSEDSDN